MELGVRGEVRTMTAIFAAMAMGLVVIFGASLLLSLLG